MRNPIFLLIPLVLLATGYKPLPSEKKAKRVKLSISYDVNAFPPNSDTLVYTGNSRHLDWSTFSGAFPAGAVAVANSAVGFKFGARISIDDEAVTLDIKIAAYFVKHQSWVDHNRKTDHILRHEQLHFDLARVGAELFRKKLLAVKLAEDNFGDHLNRAYREAWNEYLALQEQYDAETDHSINKKEQARWEEKITAAVNKIRQP
jgi:hypothetical protein